LSASLSLCCLFRRREIRLRCYIVLSASMMVKRTSPDLALPGAGFPGHDRLNWLASTAEANQSPC
jgi:hypothetical protein